MRLTDLAAIDPRLDVLLSPRAAAPDPGRRPSVASGHSRVAFRDGVIRLTPVASSLQSVRRSN